MTAALCTMVAVAVAVQLAPLPAEPGPSTDQTPAAASRGASDPALMQTEAAWSDARLAERDGETQAAVVHWSDAMASAAAIADTRARREWTDATLHNLVRSRVAAFRADGDRSHLTQARRDLAARASAPHPMPKSLAVWPAVLDAEDTPTVASATNDGPSPQRIAGIIVLAASAAPLAMFGAGLAIGARAHDDYDAGPTRADRDRADQRGATGNSLAFGGALSAAMLMGIGVGLLALSPERWGRRGRRDKIRASASVGPGGSGVVFSGRF